MMKYRLEAMRIFFICFLLMVFSPVQAFVDSVCRPLRIDESQKLREQKYSKGLLWKVGRPEQKPSYVFGTIHVSDEAVLALPNSVDSALKQSDIFVMEALPEQSDAMALAKSMFFADGQRLDSMVSPAIFKRTVEILGAYKMPTSAVTVMKPWAAFLTMSYPVDAGAVLDLELLNKAKKNGAEVHGLETLQEQGAVFEQIPQEDQIVLLNDTVCHYDLVVDDFDKMKSFYLQRDLQSLFEYAERYGFEDNSAYDDLMKRLLKDRNYTMVERMQVMLNKGNAFIAVGALHLPGDEGILSLLAKQGYVISREY